jgi:hypothetical protein
MGGAMMEERTCWLCGRNGADDPLDVHHIFGGANRKLSDKFGLTVYLCHERCHIFGPEAAHRSGETAERLHRYGQEKAMREQGWNREQFRMVFGKNYLDGAGAVYLPRDGAGGGLCRVRT